MLQLQRVSTEHPDFLRLVALLDQDLAERDGEAHVFYAPHNHLTHIHQVVLALWAGMPVGCGAIRPFDETSAEMKRMYVLPEHRRRGIAAAVLRELELWAAESGCSRCVLETGKNQPEALALYRKSGYRRMPNYGPYAQIDNSVCLEKSLG
ncbi:MAG TPA: GNAT family N-acetyltransferase [Saprospiraceae bacterium]|nr:GNAT family N-acetyltransferase [Saprospiraceae bacterium]HND87484.1 GNAT family N-acetyltransferase [Saprospiraceae bacterium]